VTQFLLWKEQLSQMASPKQWLQMSLNSQRRFRLHLRTSLGHLKDRMRIKRRHPAKGREQ
jgi:hypothetical protein